MGFAEPPASPPALVSSYLTVSPLPRSAREHRKAGFPRTRGGLLSVALSLGSLPLGVTQHPALWSSDFPRRPRNGPPRPPHRLPVFTSCRQIARGQPSRSDTRIRPHPSHRIDLAGCAAPLAPSAAAGRSRTRRTSPCVDADDREVPLADAEPLVAARSRGREATRSRSAALRAPARACSHDASAPGPPRSARRLVARCSSSTQLRRQTIDLLALDVLFLHPGSRRSRSSELATPSAFIASISRRLRLVLVVGLDRTAASPRTRACALRRLLDLALRIAVALRRPPRACACLLRRGRPRWTRAPSIVRRSQLRAGHHERALAKPSDRSVEVPQLEQDPDPGPDPIACRRASDRSRAQTKRGAPCGAPPSYQRPRAAPRGSRREAWWAEQDLNL